MKNYIYNLNYGNALRNGGCYVTGSIYRIKKNVPCYICDFKYNTASCKGEESEILTAIANNSKELTKKEKTVFKNLYYSYRDGMEAGVILTRI